jgi:glucan 1,3-beta-glucosidase
MIGLLIAAVVAQGPTLPALKVRGESLVNAQGHVVPLKGANLGNWFLLEMWMLGAGDSVQDQFDLEQTLSARFGPAEKDRLMDLYRANWMTDRDWKYWRDFGFNLARLPLNYRMFEDDDRPKKLKPDAWKWLDHAINKAAENKTYVILDMHGIQGGQSTYDHTGHSGQNKVWTSPEAQDRAAWLWQEIAKRYRNNPVVVAYDLYNEPYGGTKDQQVALFKTLYPGVRKQDPEKLILAHGNYDDFQHYGDPKANNWHNVGFQMHYYPGLFGNGSPTVRNYQKHLQRLEGVEEVQNRLNVPFLIGEFNVVFTDAGGGEMMRRTFDVHEKFGWMSTMWSFKVLTPNGGLGGGSWGCVFSKSPMPKIDFRRDTKQQIETWMRHLGKMELEPHRPFLTAFTAKNSPPPLPDVPAPVRTPPHAESVPGWSQADIGGALAGGAKVAGSSITLYSGGNDIWGTSDSFRFLHRSAGSDFDLTASVQELEDTHGYAKAGLMIRDGLAANARCIVLTMWPNGTVEAASRDQIGSEMAGKGNNEGKLQGTELQLQRVGSQVIARYKRANGVWQDFARFEGWSGPVNVGAVGLSHDNSQLGKAVFGFIRLKG